MLFMPGVIAVSVHHKRLIHFTRANWQPLLWEYLLYSFVIIFVVNFVMFLSYPHRTISFSPWMARSSSNIYFSGFIFKYSLFAIIAALGLPKLWEHRRGLYAKFKLHAWLKNLTTKIADDE
jgi:hypothetical protein